ncbi:hypothetical protein [Streptomyces sp. NBC_00576]|uniref:hypothetical protein n=1 Tax=Streptomyces sp. NBC_00576 TaxID=2903665 RepID=UPI002E806552|nr:hypothetical protein [Streptomyces sp. NBC_00576]WUB69373.1 hypothetical protein OG734_04345 [Streptomyces sp. NBC_00576]
MLFESTEPGTFFDPSTFDEIFGAKNATSRILAVSDDSGVTLELQQAVNPITTKAPDEYLRYGATSITELALTVPDIDDVFVSVSRPLVSRFRPTTSGPMAGTPIFPVLRPRRRAHPAMGISDDQST